MTPAAMSAGTAPGPCTERESGDDGDGTRSLLPPTRRTERVPVDPGPMPPRWRSSNIEPFDETRYEHATASVSLVWDLWQLVRIDGRCTGRDELRDLAALLEWLAGGGR